MLDIHNPTFQAILSFVNLALWVFVALCLMLRA